MWCLVSSSAEGPKTNEKKKKKNAEGFWSPQPNDEQHNSTSQTAAQPSGGELHRRILTEFNVTYGCNPKGTAVSFPLASLLQNINNCDDDVRKPDRGRETSKDFYMLLGLTHWNSYLWHRFGVVWIFLSVVLIRNIGTHSFGFLLDPFESNWNLHLWGCGWKGWGGGGCVCEKHSLGCGRGFAAGCTGGLLWSGHSGRGLWGPDWGSANRMFLCWPHLGRTLRIS